MDFETKVIHAGIEPEPTSGAVMTPVFLTSTYAQKAPGEHQGYEYSRTDNPTRTVLQANLAALENAEHALVFSSGLSATDAAMNLLSQGDHVLCGDDLYGGTRRLYSHVATRRGLEFDFIPLLDEAKVRAHIKPNTKMIWFESPTNPLLTIVDIGMISRVAKERGILVAIDNTFATPYFQQPLALGADLVMHSMTKYINGHSDAVIGCLMMNSQELYEKLKYLQNAIGAVPGPFDCWLALRGIKTLALRMQRHGENALAVAEWLEGHAKVERVLYPGLDSHPQRKLACSQMRGFGGMLTFFLKGDVETSRRFLSSLKLFTLAESLGGVESLIEHPGIMTHASVPPPIRAQLGITDSLIRVSVGIESARDLIADLEQGLAVV